MILLDTHVLVWLQDDPRKLSRHAESAIRRSQATSQIAVSIISLVELAGLLSRGRVRSAGTIENTLRRFSEGITVLPIDIEIASLTVSFPPDFPSDPSDRIIAATARAEGLPLVTADQRILDCPLVKTIW
jgi:PIN domain nuclease of toxin-antitoxin system